MSLIFWKKNKKTSLFEVEKMAFEKIDLKLGKSATDEDFLRVLAAMSTRWCVSDIDGQKYDRSGALKRAGMFYQLVNQQIYQETEQGETELKICG